MKTVIAGGTIVTATETYVADVMIEDEKVLMIGTDLAQWGDKVIDATGKFVMPGAIDVHTHLDMPFGGTTSCDTFTTGHVAALHGGTTMHIDFSTQPKGGSLQDGLDTWHGKANGKAVMDYGFHMIVTDARRRSSRSSTRWSSRASRASSASSPTPMRSWSTTTRSSP